MLRFRISASLIGIALLANPAFADEVSRAEKLIKDGRPAKAYEILAKSEKAEAANKIGEMAADGLLPECAKACALDWFNKAAALGKVTALDQMAVIYWNDGKKAEALSYLNQAARWNDPGAIEFLRNLGETIPEPDLWTAQVARQQEETERKRQAQAQAQNQVRQDLGNALLLGLLIVGAAGAARAGGAQSYQPYVAVAPPSVPPPYVNKSTSFSAFESSSTRLCPDGTYVYGERCHMAVDGTYTGGAPQMAPDGSYVSGRARLAPNGAYVGSAGRVILCPDGSYVAGERCMLTPNGTYVGTP